jgi:hypothetical protein
VAIEERPDGFLNRLVPLAPTLAIRIIPDVGLEGAKPDLSFAKFRYRYRSLNRAEAVAINRRIVRCAEDIVFSRDEHDWIKAFVGKHRLCRIEGVTNRKPNGTGFIVVASQRIVERRENDAVR